MSPRVIFHTLGGKLLAMAFIASELRPCPQCWGGAFRSMPDYSMPPWQIVERSACGFVYLRNPPQYDQLVSEFAWEKTRLVEVERRKTHSPIRSG